VSKVKEFLRFHLYGLGWALFIFIISQVSGRELPDKIVFGLDKVIHAGLYLILCFVVLVGEGKRKKDRFYLSYTQHFAVTICIVYGLLLELNQMVFAIGRHFDIGDAAANSVGVFLGWMVFTWIYKNTLRQEI
jgi:VanZ family protein